MTVLMLNRRFAAILAPIATVFLITPEVVLALALGGSNCENSKCERIQALSASFQTLNYFSKSDRLKGAEKLSAVHEAIRAFDAKSPRPRAEFTGLILLIAQALPYDMETTIADSVSGLIMDPSLRKTYTATLATIKDTCRRELLAVSVASHSCLALQGGQAWRGGPVRDKFSDCARSEQSQTFNFSDCLASRR